MPAEQRSPWSSWLIPGIVVLVSIALVAFVVMDSDGTEEPKAADTAGTMEYPYDMGLERRDPNDPMALGRVDAPIALIAFSDYQCPFCAKWSHDTLPPLLDRVENGQLRIEMRDVNVFGPASRRAAQAAYAAALQGRFLDYHHALYDDGKSRRGNELSADALIGIARDQGLDVERFRTDMDSATTRDAIAENEEVGAVAGAFSTPTFILGGQPIAGAQPTQVFLDRLDQLAGTGDN